MEDTVLNLYVKMQMLRTRFLSEDGQDLIEYALVIALIAFAATAGMSAVATQISTAFSKIGSRLASAVT